MVVFSDELERTLDLLTEKERNVVLVLAYYGTTCKETARLLGTTERAVLRILQRIEKKFSKSSKRGAFFAG
jgi:DNA-directed RNA polymerase specialized sigma24 family protein